MRIEPRRIMVKLRKIIIEPRRMMIELSKIIVRSRLVTVGACWVNYIIIDSELV